MSEEQTKELVKLLDFPCSEVAALRDNFGTLLRSRHDEVQKLAAAALRDLDDLQQTMAALGSRLKVCFLPSLVYQPLLFRDGLVFSARLELPSRRKQVVVMAGGEYSALLEKCFLGAADSFDSVAFGFNIALEHLAQLRVAGGEWRGL